MNAKLHKILVFPADMQFCVCRPSNCAVLVERLVADGKSVSAAGMEEQKVPDRVFSRECSLGRFIAVCSGSFCQCLIQCAGHGRGELAALVYDI